ncbi:hypothetical protein [Phenylobacterium sp.]|uniref:hypothetical protein n=1 Tax=Phenylobacterium sp. TaxID=1871053 RepID=UPI0039C98036
MAAAEFDRLADLAEAFHGPGARLLAEELDRAVVVEPRRTRRGFAGCIRPSATSITRPARTAPSPWCFRTRRTSTRGGCR